MRTPFVRALILGTTLTLVPNALAADRRIEGKVKAVDAERPTVTLTTGAGASAKDETLDVVKKARVTVNGKAATLKDVLRGQNAVAVFNTELEVVTRLDATGEGVAPMVPEMTVVNELPEPGSWRGSPWPSADGLTLYWYSKPQAPGANVFWVWSARRKTKDDLFGEAKKLVPGMDMTVTADGLEMILLNQGLHVANRPTIDAPFTRPRKLNEFKIPGGAEGQYTRPCFSGDGLTLYVDEARPGQFPVPMKFTRADRKAPWRGPTPVRIALPSGRKAAFLSVTPDGSRAFCILRETGPAAGPPELATMRAEGAGFGRPEVIRIDGEPLNGTFPRYVPATNELYFVSANQQGQPSEIRLVRNFDPDAISIARAAAAEPARPDRQAIQGEWVSVSETISGKPLTPEQIKQMNKRMSIKGDRLVVRRTGLGGKFGTYDGAFRLDPAATPGSFEWHGTSPSGTAGGWQGLYKLEGETLRLCYVETPPGKPRPTAMRSAEGSGVILVVFKRPAK